VLIDELENHDPLWIGTDISCSSCCFHVMCAELFSELRQVPDNQEVYVDMNSDMSIVIELLTLEPGESTA
jgi:Ran-interacting Mog1 protein